MNNFNDIKNKLKKLFSIDVRMLKNYGDFDELRLLNNAIKHRGTVSDGLSKKLLWTGRKKEKLIELQSHYERLSPLCLAYKNELLDRLINFHKSKYSL